MLLSDAFPCSKLIEFLNFPLLVAILINSFLFLKSIQSFFLRGRMKSIFFLFVFHNTEQGILNIILQSVLSSLSIYE